MQTHHSSQPGEIITELKDKIDEHSSNLGDLAELKASLLQMMKLKKQGPQQGGIKMATLSQGENLADFTTFHQNNQLNILKIRDQRRRIQNLLSAQKKEDEQARNQADIDNLQLQSLLYEKNHLQNQIHFCHQYQTPNLGKVLEGAPSDPEMVKKMKDMTIESISMDKSCPDVSEIRKFLQKQLDERKQLASQLKTNLAEKETCQKEFELHQKMIDEFPSHLESIEKSLKPVQTYLDQSKTEQPQYIPISDEEKQLEELLPQCLRVLYQKFKLQQQWTQQSVKVSLETLIECASNQELVQHISEFYMEQKDSKLCQNHLISKNQVEIKDENMEGDQELSKHQSRHQHRAEASSEKSEGEVLMPGIAPRSKGIKKADKLNKKVNQKKDVSVKLVDKYEKFPICLKISIDSLNFIIYLVPELDILTLSTESSQADSLVFNVDSIFGGLFDKIKDASVNSTGLVQVSQTEYICQNSKERCFNWIHSLAGVNSDSHVIGAATNVQDILPERGVFDQTQSLDEQIIQKLSANAVFSADLVIQSVKAQMESLDIFNSQIQQFVKNKAFVQSFSNKPCQSITECIFEQFHMILKVVSKKNGVLNIDIKFDQLGRYPAIAPFFTIKRNCQEKPKDSEKSKKMLKKFSLLMDQTDFQAVNQIKMSQEEDQEFSQLQDKINYQIPAQIQEKGYLLSHQVQALLQDIE